MTTAGESQARVAPQPAACFGGLIRGERSLVAQLLMDGRFGGFLGDPFPLLLVGDVADSLGVIVEGNDIHHLAVLNLPDCRDGK